MLALAWDSLPELFQLIRLRVITLIDRSLDGSVRKVQQKEGSWYSEGSKKPKPKGTMTEKNVKRSKQDIKALMGADEDFLRPTVKVILQEMLEAEMSEAVGAGKGERNAERCGYRSG